MGDDVTDPVTHLVELGMKAANAYGRPDLAQRLDTTRRRLGHTSAVVLVAGEFKAGKSSLVNALVGVDACPVDDDVSTAVLTVLGYAPRPSAQVVHFDGHQTTIEPIAGGEIPSWVTESGARRDDTVAQVQVWFPSPLLSEGITLVDTPGAGGLGGPRSALTMSAAAVADAVVFVTSSVQEITATELDYLVNVRALCESVVVVEAKTDLQARWRQVVDTDQQHVDLAGLGLDVIGVSARIRRLACDRNDNDLDEESGAPVLVGWLVDVVAAHQRLAAARLALTAVSETAAQVRVPFDAERDVLVDAAGAEALVAELTRADAVAEQTKGAAAKWSQVLSDAFTDLTTAVDRDLRERVRALLVDSEEAIDKIDPAKTWGDFERVLYERTAAAAAAHARLRHERLVDAITAVQELFGDDDEELERPALTTSAGAEGSLRVDLKRTGAVSQSLTLLRSSYGGLAMLGFFGGFAGVAIAGPVLVGVGLLLGGKGLKDDRDRQLAQRRAQAKAAARKYLDDVSYALSNETRDTVRHVQRELRDHFSLLARERQRSTQAALVAARKAVELDSTSRSERLGVVEAELRRIDGLAARARELLEAAR